MLCDWQEYTGFDKPDFREVISWCHNGCQIRDTEWISSK